jgi:SAM-dependent methyltransferase
MDANSPTSAERARFWLSGALEKIGMKALSRAIIEEVHRGIYRRHPDMAILTHWSSSLRNGTPLREAVSEMQIGANVDEAFHGIFRRPPDPKGKSQWEDDLRRGRPLREVISQLLDSEEFRAYGATVDELFHGILKRDPDPNGKKRREHDLRQGRPLRELIGELLDTEEFRVSRGRTLKQSELPDIRGALPRPYVTQKGLDGYTHHVLRVEQDSEFDLLEGLIVNHRFYDSYGGWGYTIDLDKRVTAAMAKGLGAKSCLDIGCSNGPVMSLLAKDGLDVMGIDLSHLAFALAYPNIRDRMLYGDLLSVGLNRTFDVVIAMDVFEHTNPLKLGRYIERAASLVDRDGYLLVNGPMFGEDRVFGQPFPLHLEEWTREPQDTFWRHIPCYENGWPVDGHLVWASVAFWEDQFASKGLVRDIEIECALQQALSGFFTEYAPARKMLFVLRSPDNERCPADVAERVSRVVSEVEGLPKPR